jgi:hypothetical protein
MLCLCIGEITDLSRKIDDNIHDNFYRVTKKALAAIVGNQVEDCTKQESNYASRSLTCTCCCTLHIYFRFDDSNMQRVLNSGINYGDQMRTKGKVDIHWRMLDFNSIQGQEVIIELPQKL